jgi:hypothetical protein
MKKYLAAIFAVLVTVSIPLISLAHPGHGGDDGDHGFTIIHYFTQPVHLAITLPVVIFLAWYGLKTYRRKTGNK